MAATPSLPDSNKMRELLQRKSRTFSEVTPIKVEKGSNGGTWQDAGAKGSLYGMSDLKTGMTHPKMQARPRVIGKIWIIVTNLVDDDEEEVIPRKQVSNRNKKRALDDDDEESFKDEESKG